MYLAGTRGTDGNLQGARDKGKGIATEPDTNENPFLNRHMGADSRDACFGVPDAGHDDDDFQLHGNETFSFNHFFIGQEFGLRVKCQIKSQTLLLIPNLVVKLNH